VILAITFSKNSHFAHIYQDFGHKLQKNLVTLPLAFFGNKKKSDKIWLFFSWKGLALEKHCLSSIFIKNLF